MIRIRDLKLMPGHDAQALQRAAAKALHVLSLIHIFTHLMRMQTQKNIPVSPKQAQSCAVFTIVSKSFTAKCSL